MPELHYGRGSIIEGEGNDESFMLGLTHRPPRTVTRPTPTMSRLAQERIKAQRAVDLKRYEQSLKYDDVVEREYQRRLRKAKQERVDRRPNLDGPSWLAGARKAQMQATNQRGTE